MKFLSLFLLLLMLTGCASAPADETAAPAPQETTAVIETVPTETEPVDPIRAILDETSLEDRVGQLFLARYDASTFT